MVHFVKQTAAAPIIKVTPHRRDWREVIGQHSPLASGRRDVKDCVKNIAQVGGSRSPDALGRKQKRRDQRPSPVRRITCASALGPYILLAGEFSRGQWWFRSALQPN
jgi:hypothetical protein